jgi:hypothetical protein
MWAFLLALLLHTMRPLQCKCSGVDLVNICVGCTTESRVAQQLFSVRLGGDGERNNITLPLKGGSVFAFFALRWFQAGSKFGLPHKQLPCTVQVSCPTSLSTKWTGSLGLAKPLIRRELGPLYTVSGSCPQSWAEVILWEPPDPGYCVCLIL